MRLIDPPTRIALALTLLVSGIILLADALQIVPDARTEAVLDARQKLSESVGIQAALAIGDRRLDLMQQTLAALVERNPDMLSAALRKADGQIVTAVGAHSRYWRSVADDRSTPTHVQVPLFTESNRWGTLEIAFSPVHDEAILGLTISPALKLVLFASALGFIVFTFFLRRALKVLDPSAVVPPRVRTALDALAEGVAFIDRDGYIAMVNTAFVQASGASAAEHVGRSLSDLDWCMPDSEEPLRHPPWTATLADGLPRTGVALRLGMLDGRLRSFSVNCSPIADDRGRAQGALVTLDDVTDLEGKNQRLEDTLAMLRQAQEEIRRSNEELEILATRDGLTGCLNRRTFFEHLERRMSDSHLAGEPLSVVMADIDHFKSINDNYGHQTGDKVIQFVANVLKQGLRGADAVGRYGGEEFCVVLPGSDATFAAEVAERLRERIEREVAATLSFTDRQQITSSFGVAVMTGENDTSSNLMERADQALYQSKNGGRNRVSVWSEHGQRAESTA